MYNWFGNNRNKNEQPGHSNSPDAELSNSVGTPINRHPASAETAPPIHEAEPTQEDQEHLANELTDQVGTIGQEVGVQHEGFNINQRMNLADPEVPAFAAQRATEGKSFGQKAKDYLATLIVGTGAGTAVATKVVVGTAARKAIKYTLNFAAPGAGLLAGAAAGGVWEGLKTYREESARVKSECARYREALEGIAGNEQRMEELLRLRTEDDLQHATPEQRQLLEQYRSVRRDGQKVSTAILKGMVIGGMGGLVGGALVEVASYGIHHLADAEKVKAAGEAVKKAFAYTIKPAAERTFTFPAFKNNDIVQDLSKNTWNTVKEWYRAHGIAKPTNKLINEGVRKLAALNNIEITEDHLTQAGLALHHHVENGISDIAMPADPRFQLHHLEALNGLIQAAGGHPEQMTQIISHVPGVDTMIPQPNYPVEDGVSDSLKKVGCLVVAAVAGTAAIGITRKIRDDRAREHRSLYGLEGAPAEDGTPADADAAAAEAAALAAWKRPRRAPTPGSQNGVPANEAANPESTEAHVEALRKLKRAWTSARIAMNSAEFALLDNDLASARTHYENADGILHNTSVADIDPAEIEAVRTEGNALRERLNRIREKLLREEDDLQATRRMGAPRPATDPLDEAEPVQEPPLGFPAQNRPPITAPEGWVDEPEARAEKPTLESLADQWSNLLDEADTALQAGDLQLCDDKLDEAHDAERDFYKKYDAETGSPPQPFIRHAAQIKERTTTLLAELRIRREAAEQAEEQEEPAQEDAPERVPEVPSEAISPEAPTHPGKYADEQTNTAISIVQDSFAAADDKITDLHENPERALADMLRLGDLERIDHIANQPGIPQAIANAYHTQRDELVQKIHMAGYDDIAEQLWEKLGHGDPLPFVVRTTNEPGAEQDTEAGLNHLRDLNTEIEFSRRIENFEEVQSHQQEFDAVVASMPFSTNGLVAQKRRAASAQLAKIQAVNKALRESMRNLQGGADVAGATTAEVVDPSVTPEPLVEKSTTRREKVRAAIIERARAEGIGLYPEMASKWEEFTQPKSKGGKLWGAVEKKALKQGEAIKIRAAVLTVKDWRATTKVNLAPLENAFTILLKRRQSPLLDTLISDMRSMDPAMEKACNRAATQLKKYNYIRQ